MAPLSLILHSLQPRLVLGAGPVADEHCVSVRIVHADLAAWHVIGMTNRRDLDAAGDKMLAQGRKV